MNQFNWWIRSKVWMKKKMYCIKNAYKAQQTVESHDEPVVNKKAYSDDHLSLPRAALPCLHTHKKEKQESQQQRAERRSGPAVFTEQGIECWWGKWQSHWSLGVSYAEAQVNSASTVPNSQRECSLESLMETSRNLHRKFWTQGRMCSPGSSTCVRC